MHELRLCRDLMVLIEKAVQGQVFSKILKVNVEVGSFTCIDPKALEFSFDAVKQGTYAQDAQIVWQISEPIGECPQCRFSQLIKERFESCNNCGCFPVRLTNGDDMILKTLEVE